MREVATVLIDCVRGSDIACRYGGEEFSLVFPDMSEKMLLERGEVIRKAIKQLRVNHNNTPVGTISISIGIAIYPNQADDAAQLISLADAALYQAKAKGRDCVVMSSSVENPDS